jgi:hypothetical protein
MTIHLASGSQQRRHNKVHSPDEQGISITPIKQGKMHDVANIVYYTYLHISLVFVTITVDTA